MKRGLPSAVIDTTLLTRLRALEIVDLLPLVFSRVHIPSEVRAEVGAGPGRRRRWLARLLREQSDFFVRCSDEDELTRGLLEVDLDPGEAAAIAQADHLGSEVILDETKARRRAEVMSLAVVPTGALLVRLKDAGAIALVAPYLDRLQRDGFHLSAEARARILVSSGEWDRDD